MRAGTGDGMQVGDAEFGRVTDPYRRELLAHCYRMLGSVHDAEDLLQETLLRAWRSYDRFDPRRASLRTWLYRIATNACLTALDQRSRRPLPSGLVGPSDRPEAPLVDRRSGIPWLQPVPDAMLGGVGTGAGRGPTQDPASVVVSRGSIRLAFVAALQNLPPRQRAVLILRDVLSWRAAEVADLLGTTTAAVNSALQRARAQLAQATPVEEDLVEPGDPAVRELLDRYVAAFENYDIPALTRVLREDAVLEMPPRLTWFAGRENIGRFLTGVHQGRRWHILRTAANGQPALAVYTLREDGAYHAHSVQVCAVGASGIWWIVAFQDPALFPLFGLPPTRAE